MSDTNKSPLNTSEAVWLVILPILGTAAAYLFEMGFCSFHGIPSSLIQLSPTRILVAALAGLVISFFIHHYFALALVFLFRRKALIFKFLGIGMIYAGPPLLVMISTGEVARFRLYYGLMFFLPFAFGLFPALRNKNPDLSFFERLLVGSIEASLLENNPQPAPNTAVESSTTQLGYLIDKPAEYGAIVFLAVFLFFSVGYSYAKVFPPEYVFEKLPNVHLICIYGDNWITKEYDDVTKSFKEGVTVMSKEETKQVTLKKKQR